MRPRGGTDGTEAAGGAAGRTAAGQRAAGRNGTGRSMTGQSGTGQSVAESNAVERNATGRQRAAGSAANGRAGSASTADASTADASTANASVADGNAVVFRAAVAEVEAGLGRVRELRPELSFEQEPAPRRLAPYAASVTVTAAGADGDIGWGRFVLLFDPAGQRGWGGPFRIIGHIRVDLEPEIAADPLVGEVGWSWLTEALDARAVGYQHPSGTVTRVVTEGFGAKQDEPLATEFELRASWSPAEARPPRSGQPVPAQPGADEPGADQRSGQPGSGQPTAGHQSSQPGASQPGADQRSGQPGELGLEGHVSAWCEALCAAAGLPPLAAGVSALRQPRSRRPR